MKLRLGQPVHATDAEFGEVGDIVVDPLKRTVTHLVVQPRHRHQQARLVPMWLVRVLDDVVTVQLDVAHLRQLQRVAFHDFVKLGESVTVGDGWDVGNEHVVALPYYDPLSGYFEPAVGDSYDVSYDRVPKGECEIRRRSRVTTSDDRVVGHVEGFVADGDHLVAVVVRTGIRELHRNVVIPMGSVARVSDDAVRLDMDAATFRRQRTAASLDGPMGDSSAERLTVRIAWFARRCWHSAGKLFRSGKHKRSSDGS